MELHGECLCLGIIDTHYCAVVCVYHIYLGVALYAVSANCVAVVLGGDPCLIAVCLAYGLVSASVAVLQLIGLSAASDCQHLVAKSACHHGNLAVELCDLCDSLCIFSGITGALGENYAVGAACKDISRLCVIGNHLHLTAEIGKECGEVLLCAVVNESYAVFLFACCGNGVCTIA